MPASAPPIGSNTADALRALGERLRAQRKDLRLSAVATAEAAGISRMTLHRIERGEPSVTVGAYMSVIGALGLEVTLLDRNTAPPLRKGLPSTIRPGDFPQLAKLAWQLDARTVLSAREALDLYERNWRHLEKAELVPAERELLQALLAAFGRERPLV